MLFFRNVIALCAFVSVFVLWYTPAAADVMFTYREPDTKGFMVFHRVGMHSGAPGDARGVYGEHDIFCSKIPVGDRLAVSYRSETGSIGEDVTIQHIGLRYNKAFTDTFRVGALVSFAYRSPYTEYYGQSYRVMPTVEWQLTDAFMLRYLFEWDVIPRATVTSEDILENMGNAQHRLDREYAIYSRLDLGKFTDNWIKNYTFDKNVILEIKSATGLAEFKWSHEYFWNVVLSDRVALYYSKVAAGDMFTAGIKINY